MLDCPTKKIQLAPQVFAWGVQRYIAPPTRAKRLAICGPRRTRVAITTTATRAMIKPYSIMPCPRFIDTSLA